MNNISFTVNGNKLTMTGNANLTSGSFYSDTCVFTFDQQWNGYAKTIVFSLSNGEEFSESVVDNQFIIPNEVLKSAGLFKMGLVGINGAGNIISTNFVAIRVATGANETETKPIAMANVMHNTWGGPVG